ncbi:MAG: molecular chaperone [Deltaproteobacteria bacterium]|nr:molecular chaperone [Deltaproteobacteria bacterium]
MNRTLLATLGLCALCGLVSLPARAGQFSVSPMKVELGERTKSVLVTLRNTGTEATRFQASVFRWDQSAESDMQLAPTDDLLVYPTLLTLAPGEARKVRIGTTKGPGPTESAYRVFFEELPPLEEDGSAVVRMLTRVSIPAFVGVKRPSATATVTGLALDDGVAQVDLTNEGNTHLKVEQVEVSALGAGGVAIATASARGWYLLAGRERLFDIELPEHDCTAVRRLTALVVTDEGEWTANEAVDPGACRR